MQVYMASLPMVVFSRKLYLSCVRQAAGDRVEWLKSQVSIIRDMNPVSSVVLRRVFSENRDMRRQPFFITPPLPAYQY